MRHTIESPGSFPFLQVLLGPGESFVAEAGAMSWMSPEMKVRTSARGGLGRSLKRRVLGGESLFQNTYYTEAPEASVSLVPGQPGDILELAMDGRELFLEKSAYLASQPEVDLDTKFQGLKGLFNEGLFVLRASGSGTLFFSGYGAVTPVAVDGEYVVDNGYAVAWDGTLSWSLTRARKIRSFLFGDQLLLSFTGRGTVWIQSRSPVSFANWVYPYRRVRRRD